MKPVPIFVGDFGETASTVQLQEEASGVHHTPVSRGDSQSLANRRSLLWNHTLCRQYGKIPMSFKIDSHPPCFPVKFGLLRRVLIDNGCIPGRDASRRAALEIYCYLIWNLTSFLHSPKNRLT